MRALGSDRIGVCLDTAHLWASGYDISSARGVRHVLDAADRHIGLNNVKVLHVNDTRVALGAKHDLHWHVGEGHIGAAGFQALFAIRALSHVACICETPKSPADDLRNVRRTKALARTRRAGTKAKQKVKM